MVSEVKEGDGQVLSNDGVAAEYAQPVPSGPRVCLLPQRLERVSAGRRSAGRWRARSGSPVSTLTSGRVFHDESVLIIEAA